MLILLTTRAADAAETYAGPDYPKLRQRDRRGDLRCSPPHSQGLGCHLWPGRREGRPAKARPPCWLCTPAPRHDDRYSLASRRQREGRGVLRTLAPWQRRLPAALAGRG